MNEIISADETCSYSTQRGEKSEDNSMLDPNTELYFISSRKFVPKEDDSYAGPTSQLAGALVKLAKFRLYSDISLQPPSISHNAKDYGSSHGEQGCLS